MASPDHSEQPTKVWYAPNRHQAFGEEEISAIVASLRTSGWLGGDGGPCVAEFERRISDLFGKRYGVFTNSGSSANELGALALTAALQIKPGDEIITPAITFSTTVAPWERLCQNIHVQVRLVFCDAAPGRYVPDVATVMACVTDRTRVIVIPNLIGEKPDWAGLRVALAAAGRSDVVLFEDSCDVITHTAESDIATCSFYASHMITTGGAGGICMVNREDLRDLCHNIRDWGRGSPGGAAGFGDGSENMLARFAHDVDGIPFDHKFLYTQIGHNFKGAEINAAFGLAQLDKLEQFTAIRRALFARYMEQLANVPDVQLSLAPNTLYMAFPLQTDRRMELFNFLEANGVQTRVLFSGNITRHPAYRHHLRPFPEADRIMARGGLLGCHQGMTIADVDRVCGLIRQFFASCI